MIAPVVIPCGTPGVVDLLEYACPVRALVAPYGRGLWLGPFGVLWAANPSTVTQADLGLDIGERAGAWRAAIWIIDAGASDARWPGLTAAETELVEMAIWAETLSVEHQAELRDLALRLAAILATPRAGA